MGVVYKKNRNWSLLRAQLFVQPPKAPAHPTQINFTKSHKETQIFWLKCHMNHPLALPHIHCKICAMLLHADLGLKNPTKPQLSATKLCSNVISIFPDTHSFGSSYIMSLLIEPSSPTGQTPSFAIFPSILAPKSRSNLLRWRYCHHTLVPTWMHMQ